MIRTNALRSHSVFPVLLCWMIALSPLQCEDDMEIHLSHHLTFAQFPSNNFFGTALLLTILFPLAAISLKNCYFPDGTAAPNDVPCNPTWDESACCGSGWDCLDNGTLCIPSKDDPSTVGDMARGTCTDRDWLSHACPSFCVGMLVRFSGFTCLLPTATSGKLLTPITCTSCSVAQHPSNTEQESVSSSRFGYVPRSTTAGQTEFEIFRLIHI